MIYSHQVRFGYLKAIHHFLFTSVYLRREVPPISKWCFPQSMWTSPARFPKRLPLINHLCRCVSLLLFICKVVLAANRGARRRHPSLSLAQHTWAFGHSFIHIDCDLNWCPFPSRARQWPLLCLFSTSDFQWLFNLSRVVTQFCTTTVMLMLIYKMQLWSLGLIRFKPVIYARLLLRFEVVSDAEWNGANGEINHEMVLSWMAICGSDCFWIEGGLAFFFLWTHIRLSIGLVLPLVSAQLPGTIATFP